MAEYPPGVTNLAPTAPVQRPGTTPAANVTAVTVPPVQMDDVTKRAILQNQQRAGWIASDPVAHTEVQQNPVTGTQVTVTYYTMNIADPTTKATQQIKLSYDPNAVGKGAAWNVMEGPGDLPKPPAGNTLDAQTVVVGGQIYGVDPTNPTGPLVVRGKDQATIDKAAADAKDALARAGLSEAQADALSKKTDSEIQDALSRAGLSDAQAKQILNNIKIANQKVESDIGLSTAQASQANAQAGSLQTAADISKQKAPGEIALTAAQTAEALKRAGYSDAQIKQLTQQIEQAKAPTTETAQQGLSIYQRDPNTGALTAQFNQNFIPKTQADVAARVGQLQTMATAKRDELQSKISANYTADQAAKDFDTWWNAQVEPQKAALTAAQQTAGQEQQRLQEEQQRANYATAQTAGQNAVDAQKALLPYMVGPGFGNAMNQMVKGWGTPGTPDNIDVGSAVTFKAPDFNAISQNAVAQALAHISPTAAGIAGQGMPNVPQNLDVSQALSANNYRPMGGAPPAVQRTTTTIQPQPQPMPTYPGLAQGGGNFNPAGSFMPMVGAGVAQQWPNYAPSF